MVAMATSHSLWGFYLKVLLVTVTVRWTSDDLRRNKNRNFLQIGQVTWKMRYKGQRKNLEYLVVAAIGKPRTDKNSRFGRKIMAKSK